MTLSRDEAENTLRDISKTERRSSNLFGYRFGAPHLFLWGAIWMVAYGASYARPQWSIIWPILIVVGSVGSFWLSWRVKSARTDTFGWRYGGTFVAVFLFISAIFAIMPPKSDAQVAAFFPILVALFYLLIGIWTRGTRMIVLGLAVGALTLFGYFDLPAYFLLWMAVVGGGGMILGGFWFEERVMDQPNAIIHQPVRLKIMAALRALPPGEQLEFVRLKAIVGATEGNLGAHITTLEDAGYAAVEKDFVGKKPRTRVALTKDGRRAFEDYVAELRAIIDTTQAK